MSVCEYGLTLTVVYAEVREQFGESDSPLPLQVTGIELMCYLDTSKGF